MKRKPTHEQIAKAEERRAKLRKVWQKIGAMSEEERAALAQTLPQVVTCEGHSLTINNTLLLCYQAKNVTVVGGFHQWKKAGRMVSKGQRALGIWIPTNAEKKEEPKPGEAEKPIRFIFGSVFDISQTEPLEV